MCTKKPVIHFSQNCTCAKRNSQWASTYQRNLRCHHSMAARCLEYNGRHIQNKSKQYKCWKFWQEENVLCNEAGFSLGHLHMGTDLSPPIWGTSAGRQSINRGDIDLMGGT